MRSVALVACVLFALPAAAETILILPIQGHGKLEASALHRTEQELERGLSERGATVIGPKAANKLLGDADAAAHKCKEKPTCLSALGQRAKAQKVLSGRASADGKTMTIHFVLIASEGGAQVQTASLAFPPGSEIDKVVSDGLSRVVPMEEAEMPALQAVVSLKKKPKVIEAAPAEAGPELAAPMKVSNGPPARSRALLYTGIAVAVVGVAGLGTGLGFGAMAQGTAANVNPTTRQIDAVATERQANQQVNIANVGIGIGSSLLVIGVALIVTDIILHKRVQPRLSVSAGGAQGSFEVSF